jgi:hypothetical protein
MEIHGDLLTYTLTVPPTASKINAGVSYITPEPIERICWWRRFGDIPW